MSTGNNQSDTIVSKKRKRVVRGFKHPGKVEVKKFDFFTGLEPYSGSLKMSNAYEIYNIYEPIGNAAATSSGSWKLIKMVDPYSGTTSYERVGLKYYLRYIKFKGYINVEAFLPVTIHYKLVLIKTDDSFPTVYDFMARCYNNFQPMNNQVTFTSIEKYCRHNFYKTYKDFEGMSDSKTSVTVISSGTIAPQNEVSRPTTTSTLGTNPSITWTFPASIGFDSPEGVFYQASNYLPINASITVNENVKVGETHFYLLLMTDQYNKKFRKN